MGWAVGPAPDIDTALFTEVTHTDPDTGITHTWHAADTTVDLPIADTSRTFGMRQITRTTQTRTGVHQAHVLTTRLDLPAGEVLHRMGSRWRLENYFRYARIHFDLDAHDSYTTTADDPERAGPTGRNHAADQLAAAEATYAAIPTRLPLGQVHPGQQVLDTETKLITHAIRMAAFNTITAMARDIRINTGHPRAADEAHTLARQALGTSGDIHPGHDTLTITLDPLPTRRATAAIAELCAHLTATATRYPGTDLTLRYAIKNQP